MPVILLAGDSITYGFWDTQGGWAGRLRSFLDKRCLDAKDPSTLNTIRYTAVYNLGIPGDTSRGLKERFEREVQPRFDSEQETITLIAIGTNDSAFEQSTNDFQIPLDETHQNIYNLIHSAKRFGQKVVVIGLPPVDEAKTNPIYWNTNVRYTNEYIEKYNNTVREVAQQEQVPFIEIFEKMKLMNVADLMEDGIHPNEKGHQLMFEMIKDFLIEKAII